MTDSIGSQRFNTVLMGLFAALAMLLAAVGVYGVLGHMVGQRTHELGIRMALGASGRDITRLVLGELGVLLGTGLVVGLAGALALSRLLSSLLYGVSSTDPGAFAP